MNEPEFGVGYCHDCGVFRLVAYKTRLCKDCRRAS